jgi:hypothetical protein
MCPRENGLPLRSVPLVVLLRLVLRPRRWASSSTLRTQRLVEIFDAQGASFVSVTQQFNHHELDGTSDPQWPVTSRSNWAKDNSKIDLSPGGRPI